MEETNISLM